MFDVFSSTPESGAIQVRLLGGWKVQAGGGHIVDPRQWRTGKTADLVRILALAGGRPVPASQLVSALWSSAPAANGQASLRTATSQIRSVLGTSTVQRGAGGVVLSCVWVDAVAFRQLALVQRQCMRVGDFARVTRIARAAAGLYAGDLRVHDEEAEWAASARSELADAYRTLLVDAAEAALISRSPADALDFALKATERDPYCERASRALMTAYAALGETSSALWEFQRVRDLLSDELGVDPAPQTFAVHLSVLRGEPIAPITGLESA
jgi:SARP family transcriptional regulator, regulator of embCAB operon